MSSSYLSYGHHTLVLGFISLLFILLSQCITTFPQANGLATTTADASGRSTTTTSQDKQDTTDGFFAFASNLGDTAKWRPDPQMESFKYRHKSWHKIYREEGMHLAHRKPKPAIQHGLIAARSAADVKPRDSKTMEMLHGLAVQNLALHLALDAALDIGSIDRKRGIKLADKLLELIKLNSDVIPTDEYEALLQMRNSWVTTGDRHADTKSDDSPNSAIEASAETTAAATAAAAADDDGKSIGPDVRHIKSGDGQEKGSQPPPAPLPPLPPIRNLPLFATSFLVVNLNDVLGTDGITELRDILLGRYNAFIRGPNFSKWKSKLFGADAGRRRPHECDGPHPDPKMCGGPASERRKHRGGGNDINDVFFKYQDSRYHDYEADDFLGRHIRSRYEALKLGTADSVLGSDPSFIRLMHYLNDALDQYLEENGLTSVVTPNVRDRNTRQFLGWTSVHPANSFHPAHCHEDATLGAVFYPHVNEDDEGGALRLFDPRARPPLETSLPRADYEHNEIPTVPFGGGGYRFRPKTGDLVIFPGWLLHGVEPTRKITLRCCCCRDRDLQTTDPPRISYAWNLLGPWQDSVVPRM